MSADLSKIHVTNSTGLSLNDRFTAIASTSAAAAAPVAAMGERRGRSRSRSRARSVQRSQFPPVNAATSQANARLLKNLARKHSVQAALKLKRRSMQNARTASILRGQTLRRNGATATLGTMRSDLIAARRGNLQPMRRANSIASINGAGRLNGRSRAGIALRPTVGGAAERIARRQFERLLAQRAGLRAGGVRGSTLINQRRGRSRSRSRAAVLATNALLLPRVRGRSRSRGRMPAATMAAPLGNMRRARSSSRNRAALNNPRRNGAARISVKDRLGVRPGATGTNQRGRRGNSVSRRGVLGGRVEKRRQNVGNAANGTGGRLARERVRATARGAVNRSRSRTRRGQVGNSNGAGQGKQQQRQQQRSGNNNNNNNNNNGMERGRGRSRSRQRNVANGRNNNTANVQQRNRQGQNGRQGARKNGRQNGRQNNSKGRNPQSQQQQRRGRSRSRSGRGGAAAAGGSNQAKGGARPQVSRDALDQELDQYMATTKTESNMDYILNN